MDSPKIECSHSGIARVLNLYGFLLDLREFDRLDEVFTTDAVVDYDRAGVRVGLDNLVEMFRRSCESVSATQHNVGSHLIYDLTTDNARALTNVTTHHVIREGSELTRSVGPDGTFTSSGRYADEFHRTKDGWRIAHRKYESISHVGDPTLITIF